MKKFYILVLACAISAFCLAQDPYSYEVVSDTTIDIEGISAYFQRPIGNDGSYLPYYVIDIYQDNSEEFFISIAFLAQSDGSFEGKYTVSASPNSVAPGQFLQSSGVHDGGIWPTYVCRMLPDGGWDAYHAFFINGGEMNIKYTDVDEFEVEITATFTTVHGSTINLHYLGDVPAGMHTAVNDVEAERLDVTVSGHTMHCLAAEPYKVYGMNGSLIYYGTANEIELPADGMYVVLTQSGKTAKVAVR